MQTQEYLEKEVGEILKTVTFNHDADFGCVFFPLGGIGSIVNNRIGTNIHKALIRNQTDLGHKIYRLYPVRTSIAPSEKYSTALSDPASLIYCWEIHGTQSFSAQLSRIVYKSILVLDGNGKILRHLNPFADGNGWNINSERPSISEIFEIINKFTESFQNAPLSKGYENSLKVGMACFVENLSSQYPDFYPSHLVYNLDLLGDNATGLAMILGDKLFPYYYCFGDEIYYAFDSEHDNFSFIPFDDKCAQKKLREFFVSIDNKSHCLKDRTSSVALSTPLKKRK